MWGVGHAHEMGELRGTLVNHLGSERSHQCKTDAGRQHEKDKDPASFLQEVCHLLHSPGGDSGSGQASL